jgi:cytochrome bd ubiquinol oxidase subunit II
VFLCLDGRREGEDDLADQFRTRALGTAAVTGVVGLIGIFVLRADAPLLFAGLLGRALPVIIVSVVAGLATIALLVVRRYRIARVTASVAVAAILVGWAVGQYPYLLLPYLTIEDAAGPRTTLIAMTVVLIVGSFVLVPALVYMFALFSRPEAAHPDLADPRLREVGGSVTAR